MPINPRTLDIETEFGGILPYPGYGGDVALPPTTRITGMFHDGTMPPAAYDVSEAIQVDDPVEAVPVAQSASTRAEVPKPTIGIDPREWRRQHGLEAPAPQLSMPNIGPRDEDYPTDKARADEAALTLADNPGRFHETTPSVSMDDVSLAGMAGNARADALIDSRHRARMAAIDRNERDPMKEELAARQVTAQLEDASTLQRPLIGEKGAFTRKADGSYANNAPAEGLQDFRKREASHLNTILGSAVMRKLQEELGRIERGTSVDEEGSEAPLAQPMNEDQKEKARRDAFRIAAFALQNYAGGKDYSGFFRETYDPNDIRLGR